MFLNPSRRAGPGLAEARGPPVRFPEDVGHGNQEDDDDTNACAHGNASAAVCADSEEGLVRITKMEEGILLSSIGGTVVMVVRVKRLYLILPREKCKPGLEKKLVGRI